MGVYEVETEILCTSGIKFSLRKLIFFFCPCILTHCQLRCLIRNEVMIMVLEKEVTGCEFLYTVITEA